MNTIQNKRTSVTYTPRRERKSSIFIRCYALFGIAFIKLGKNLLKRHEIYPCAVKLGVYASCREIVLLLLAIIVSSLPIASYGKTAEWKSLTPLELYKESEKYARRSPAAPDSAMACLQLVYDRLKDSSLSPKNGKLMSATLLDMGYLWVEEYNDYARGYQCYRRALALAEQYNPYDLAYAYLGMAACMQHLPDGKFSEWSPNMESPAQLCIHALRSAIVTSNPQVAMLAASDICDEAIRLNNVSLCDSVEHYLRTVKLPPSTPGLQLVRIYLKAARLMGEKKYSEMAEACEQAKQLSVSDTVTVNRQYFMARQQKVRALLLAKDHVRAHAELQDFLNESRRRDLKDFALWCLQQLRDLSRETGNDSEVRRWNYEYLAYKDSLQEVFNINHIREAEMIERLSETGQRLEKERSQKHVNFLIALFSSLIALLVIGALVYVLHLHRKVRAANHRLYENIQQLLGEKETETIPDAGHANIGSRSLPRHSKEYEAAVEAMEKSQEIYNPEFSIRTLENLTGIPAHELSAAINGETGDNFKKLLAGLRIKEACRRLSDIDSYGHLTIEAIALGVGFKSRTYFASLFKAHTGMSPTVYMSIARDKNKPQQ